MTAIPRVSIGLTVYNGERYLEETLNSILAQSFTDFELIICDNASTDRTLEIARNYCAMDQRIRCHCNGTNLGLAGNHNMVFSLANGEYFKWAADDDLLLPEHLERCVEILDANPDVVLAYPNTQFVDLQGDPLDVEDSCWHLESDKAIDRLKYVIAYRGAWANAVVGLIRSSALAKTRLMPAYHGGDYRVLGELSLLGKFYEIPETLFVRRLHPGSSSQFGNQGKTPDKNWLIKYWTGKSSGVSLPNWGINRDYFYAIRRSSLPLFEKLSLTRVLLRHMRWERGLLFQELVSAIPASLPRWSSSSVTK